MRGEAKEHAAGVCHEDPQQVGDAQAVGIWILSVISEYCYVVMNTLLNTYVMNTFILLGLYCYEDPQQVGDAQTVGDRKIN